jgi:hypothetical protein
VENLFGRLWKFADQSPCQASICGLTSSLIVNCFQYATESILFLIWERFAIKLEMKTDPMSNTYDQKAMAIHH